MSLDVTNIERALEAKLPPGILFGVCSIAEAEKRWFAGKLKIPKEKLGIDSKRLTARGFLREVAKSVAGESLILKVRSMMSKAVADARVGRIPEDDAFKSLADVCVVRSKLPGKAELANVPLSEFFKMHSPFNGRHSLSHTNDLVIHVATLDRGFTALGVDVERLGREVSDRAISWAGLRYPECDGIANPNLVKFCAKEASFKYVCNRYKNLSEGKSTDVFKGRIREYDPLLNDLHLSWDLEREVFWVACRSRFDTSLSLTHTVVPIFTDEHVITVAY
ncbi:MAG: hypothetical protein NUW37_01040 [Planctomycetes bacterium]|nr:hypothetical protein [Planctomycetota bacterium]